MSIRDIKICLVGETQVGKTSIVNRFVNDTYSDRSETTVGAFYTSKTILVDDKTIRFQIWDTAGQEKYRALAPMYYRGAEAALIVYDITKKSSFYAMQSWRNELYRFGPAHIVIAIAGNKCDQEDQREVTKEDAKKYAEEIGAFHCETSAKTSVNITELFDAIARLLPIKELLKQTNGSTVDLSKTSSNKRGQCCSGRNGTTNKKSSSPRAVEHRSLAVPRSSEYSPSLSLY